MARTHTAFSQPVRRGSDGLPLSSGRCLRRTRLLVREKARNAPKKRGRVVRVEREDKPLSARKLHPPRVLRPRDRGTRRASCAPATLHAAHAPARVHQLRKQKHKSFCFLESARQSFSPALFTGQSAVTPNKICAGTTRILFYLSLKQLNRTSGSRPVLSCERWKSQNVTLSDL